MIHSHKPTLFLLLCMALFFMHGCSNKNYPREPSSIADFAPDAAAKESEIQLRELKVHVREIADQLLEHYPGQSLNGRFAIPTSFVNLNNRDESNELGRYISEALIHEFTMHGLLVYEYRTTNTISSSDEGDFIFKDKAFKHTNKKKNALYIIGSYLKDEAGFFINARLIEPTGRVLRTAQVVLPMNHLLARMTSVPTLETGSMKIKSSR